MQLPERDLRSIRQRSSYEAFIGTMRPRNSPARPPEQPTTYNAAPTRLLPPSYRPTGSRSHYRNHRERNAMGGVVNRTRRPSDHVLPLPNASSSRRLTSVRYTEIPREAFDTTCLPFASLLRLSNRRLSSERTVASTRYHLISRPTFSMFVNSTSIYIPSSGSSNRHRQLLCCSTQTQLPL